MNITIIAALQNDRGIGIGNKLPWRIPADLKRFKDLTTGHPVIMGRATFESIVAHIGKPLPGRSNIVLSKTHGAQTQGTTRTDVYPASSFEEALELAHTLPGHDEVFIIGGAGVYATGLIHADKLLLTEVDATELCDTFFPAFDTLFEEVSRQEEQTEDGLSYAFVEYRRRASRHS